MTAADARLMEALTTIHAMTTQNQDQIISLQTTITTQANQMAELQQLMIGTQQQWQTMHNELHTAVKAVATPSGPSGADRSKPLLDSKTMAPDTFSGESKSMAWRDWSYRVRSWVGSYYPKLRNLMERVEQSARAVTEDDILTEGVNLSEVEQLKGLSSSAGQPAKRTWCCARTTWRTAWSPTAAWRDSSSRIRTSRTSTRRASW